MRNIVLTAAILALLGMTASGCNPKKAMDDAKKAAKKEAEKAKKEAAKEVKGAAKDAAKDAVKEAVAGDEKKEGEEGEKKDE